MEPQPPPPPPPTTDISATADFVEKKYMEAFGEDKYPTIFQGKNELELHVHAREAKRAQQFLVMLASEFPKECPPATKMYVSWYGHWWEGICRCW